MASLCKCDAAVWIKGAPSAACSSVLSEELGAGRIIATQLQLQPGSWLQRLVVGEES